MSKGYLMADFKWRNPNGYEYSAVDMDEGFWEIRYREDGQPEKKTGVTFSVEDAAGLISVIQNTIDFYREHNPEPPQ